MKQLPDPRGSLSRRKLSGQAVIVEPANQHISYTQDFITHDDGPHLGCLDTLRGDETKYSCGKAEVTQGTLSPAQAQGAKVLRAWKQASRHQQALCAGVRAGHASMPTALPATRGLSVPSPPSPHPGPEMI